MFEDVEEFVPKEKTNQLHFFYNREERLKNAPENVKAYYRGEMKPVHGVKIFFTKQNRYIFFALIFFVAATWLYTGLNHTRNYSRINNIDCNLQAFLYGDDIYTTINFKLNPKVQPSGTPQKINASIFAIDADNQISNKQELSDLFADEEITLRTKFTDYEIKRIDVILNIEGSEKELSTIVKR